ncbi:MAG: hypothetical protein WD873_07115, partial [Candidatus Hydrogenedentales bacterium]
GEAALSTQDGAASDAREVTAPTHAEAPAERTLLARRPIEEMGSFPSTEPAASTDAPPAGEMPAAPAADVPLPNPAVAATGVTWSSVPPSALRSDRHHNAGQLFLAPPGAVASPMEVGTKLLLRPPVPGAVFDVTTRRATRAQVVVSDQAPAPAPEGLVPFTYYFAIEHEPHVPGATAVSLSISPRACAPERRSELRLFTFDEDNGWLPAEKPRVNLKSGNFSILDLGLRTYAVLGPADALLEPPTPLQTQN